MTHGYIFMLTKSPRYIYHADPLRVRTVNADEPLSPQPNLSHLRGRIKHENGDLLCRPAMRDWRFHN